MSATMPLDDIGFDRTAAELANSEVETVFKGRLGPEGIDKLSKQIPDITSLNYCYFRFPGDNRQLWLSLHYKTTGEGLVFPVSVKIDNSFIEENDENGIYFIDEKETKRYATYEFLARAIVFDSFSLSLLSEIAKYSEMDFLLEDRERMKKEEDFDGYKVVITLGQKLKYDCSGPLSPQTMLSLSDAPPRTTAMDEALSKKAPPLELVKS